MREHPEYYILQEGEFEEYMEYVQNLPDEESPKLVGLHENANIVQAINESTGILEDILKVSRSSQAAVVSSSQT